MRQKDVNREEDGGWPVGSLPLKRRPNRSQGSREECHSLKHAEPCSIIHHDEAVKTDEVAERCHRSRAGRTEQDGKSPPPRECGHEVQKNIQNVPRCDERHACQAQQCGEIKKEIRVKDLRRHAVAAKLDGIDAHGQLPAAQALGNAFDAPEVKREILPQKDMMRRKKRETDEDGHCQQSNAPKCQLAFPRPLLLVNEKHTFLLADSNI